MRGRQWGAAFVAAMIVGCASAPPAAPPAREERDAAPEPAPVETETETETVTGIPAPERAQPSSTKSYDEALATPERLDVNDERMHLTDGQLTGPVRGVLAGCRVPSNARVTVKTAVQNGRAIGVTVLVRFEHPKSARPRSRATVKYEAKTSAKIIACVDRAVRAVVWPPSRRRDSFSTDF